MLPPDHQVERLVRALHQRDGLLTGAAQQDAVHAHHLVASLQTNRRRRATLLHLGRHKTQPTVPLMATG